MKQILLALILTSGLAAQATTYTVNYVVQDSSNIPVLAVADGWAAQIQDGNGDLMDNPVSATEYLKVKFEQHCKQYPTRLYAQVIRGQKRIEENQAVSAFSSLVEQGLTVTVE